MILPPRALYRQAPKLGPLQGRELTIVSVVVVVVVAAAVDAAIYLNGHFCDKRLIFMSVCGLPLNGSTFSRHIVKPIYPHHAKWI